MDFGSMSFDGLGGVEGGLSPLLSAEAETREKRCGSLLSKQGEAEDWRGLKMARTDDFGMSRAIQMQPRGGGSALRPVSLFSDCQQQMLSFSSPESVGGVISGDGFAERSYQNAALPYFHSISSSYGLGYGSSNGKMNYGTLAGVKGSFTPSQWMELEQQALIYKYITSDVPVPSNLLIAIRKSLNPSGFTGFTAGSLRPNPLGWNSFHLGFSGNTDPEPGRCRRTDGKKWRCSRDAVADQKYCERHMNRGRHRSRKPVEGQIGHASSCTGAAAAAKTMPTIASSSTPSVPSGGALNSLSIAQQQMKSLRPGADPSTTQESRILMNKINAGDNVQTAPTLSFLSTVDPKPKDAEYAIPKQPLSFEETGQVEFGLVPTDSFLNPQRSSYELNDRESQSHPLRHFIDWPKSQSDSSAITWPDVEDIQSDRTQLSISIPRASSDFSSSTSSPAQDRVPLSPLKLSRDFDPIQMGLGVGENQEPNQRQATWIPISWETSMGGPLAEVLNNTNNTPRDSKNSSALNLMSEGWDASPQIGSSPTGVLQKTTFGSLSNSSSGSSPRTEVNRAHDHIGMCDDLLGSTVVNSSIPSLLSSKLEK